MTSKYEKQEKKDSNPQLMVLKTIILPLNYFPNLAEVRFELTTMGNEPIELPLLYSAEILFLFLNKK
jgi:hypothetical protein